MDITFHCPRCRQSLETPESLAGQAINCPACRNSIRVPDALPRRPVQSGPSSIPPTTKTSGLAIASMVVGIVGLAGGWFCCGILLPLTAIIMGHIAYARIGRKPKRLICNWFAIAVFTTGYVGLVLAVIVSIMLGTVTAAMEQSLHMVEQSLKSIGP